MRRRLWLVGGGHAHALVLRQWARTGLPADVDVTLLSPSPLAPYSGMVPGWLAGRYRFAEICIDLRVLAQQAGVAIRESELLALDAEARVLTLADGSREVYDLLSLNVGSTLTPPTWPDARILALRPLAALPAAWAEVLEAPPPQALLTVGGGAAGVEATLAVLAQLRRRHAGWAGAARLTTRSETVLEGFPAGARRAAAAALARAGVVVQCGLEAAASMAPRGTLVLWAAGATAHPWQRRCALAQDADGFLRVEATLRSPSHPEVFASGDCASLPVPLPKSGVFAVRQGPLLAGNLRAALDGGTPHAFTRNGAALALLSTADGRAIAARGAWSLSGPWLGRLLWLWKDYIDRAFVRGPS